MTHIKRDVPEEKLVLLVEAISATFAGLDELLSMMLRLESVNTRSMSEPEVEFNDTATPWSLGTAMENRSAVSPEANIEPE